MNRSVEFTLKLEEPEGTTIHSVTIENPFGPKLQKVFINTSKDSSDLELKLGLASRNVAEKQQSVVQIRNEPES